MPEINDLNGDELDHPKEKVNEPKQADPGISKKEIADNDFEHLSPQDKKQTKPNRNAPLKSEKGNLEVEKTKPKNHQAAMTDKYAGEESKNNIESQTLSKKVIGYNHHEQNSSIIGFKLKAQKITDILIYIADKFGATASSSGGGKSSGELLVAKKIVFERIINGKNMRLELWILIDRSDIVKEIMKDNNEIRFQNLGDTINYLEKNLTGN